LICGYPGGFECPHRIGTLSWLTYGWMQKNSKRECPRSTSETLPFYHVEERVEIVIAEFL
jgi:hypothetical protein